MLCGIAPFFIFAVLWFGERDFKLCHDPDWSTIFLGESYNAYQGERTPE